MRRSGHSSRYAVNRLHGAAGFTLLEVLTALAVMSVAVYILMSMFLASLQVGEGARLQDTAAAIASEQMQALVNSPDSFAWPAFAGDGAAIEVLPAHESDEWHAPSVPDALPSVREAHDHERVFHERFGWRAYARPLVEAPAVVEVSVVVKWTHRGRPQSFVLTSAIPRAAITAPGGPA
jgi:prepilin-type N-terminal cleavage/methylation domain-containing protein